MNEFMWKWGSVVQHEKYGRGMYRGYASPGLYLIEYDDGTERMHRMNVIEKIATGEKHEKCADGEEW